jgi:hypothetical protein
MTPEEIAQREETQRIARERNAQEQERPLLAQR